ncbi:hypothetical protein L1987_05932 [Smallanthus sonchifolius]|uniref:Uncharacterized protein n=1 Tax=Smallanthus sonchifolius TaxID=185202 RepID=A0ACB9JWP0_9ASTR|nr:hypothetical protein L1987_05932 [Smallanthus sonchifolius]
MVTMVEDVVVAIGIGDGEWPNTRDDGVEFGVDVGVDDVCFGDGFGAGENESVLNVEMEVGARIRGLAVAERP